MIHTNKQKKSFSVLVQIAKLDAVSANQLYINLGLKD